MANEKKSAELSVALVQHSGKSQALSKLPLATLHALCLESNLLLPLQGRRMTKGELIVALDYHVGLPVYVGKGYLVGHL